MVSQQVGVDPIIRITDALDGIGHACGHNLIAVMSVGAAMATAEVMRKEKLGGKVVLFGTPAEGR